MRSLTQYANLETVRTRKLITGPAVAVALAIAVCAASTAEAQTYSTARARRHFVTVAYHWGHTEPLHFANHPLEDLVGKSVAEAQFETFDYRTRDETILIDVLEFSRPGRGASVTVYPFGMSVGTTLALRGSIDEMPIVRVAFQGEGAPPAYRFTGGRAYDVGLGLYVADRAPGWGLGSHAFVMGGIGRISANERDGRRYFAEGGGGLSSGPLGVELAVKFAWNHFTEPVKHQFLTIPVIVRGTLIF
jgi:hypothetical protein